MRYYCLYDTLTMKIKTEVNHTQTCSHTRTYTHQQQHYQMSKTENAVQFINIWHFGWFVLHTSISCVSKKFVLLWQSTHSHRTMWMFRLRIPFLRNMPIKHRRVSTAHDKKLETCNRKRMGKVKRAFAQMQKWKAYDRYLPCK